MSIGRGDTNWITLTLGSGLLATGIVIWLVPQTISRLPIADLLIRFPATVWITLLVVLGGIPTLLGVVGRSTRPVEPLTQSGTSDIQESGSDRPDSLGTSIEQLIDQATDPDRPRALRQDAKEELETELRELAIESLIAKGDLDRETAREVVRTGAWSDDPRATVVLGDATAPSPPIYLWIVDLFRRENAYRRRIRHALREIHELDRATIESQPLEMTQS